MQPNGQEMELPVRVSMGMDPLFEYAKEAQVRILKKKVPLPSK